MSETIAAHKVEKDNSHLYWGLEHAPVHDDSDRVHTFSLGGHNPEDEQRVVYSLMNFIDSYIVNECGSDANDAELLVVMEPTVLYYPDGMFEVRCIFGVNN